MPLESGETGAARVTPFERLFALAPIGMALVHDESGAVLLANDRLASLVGKEDTRAVVGQTLATLAPGLREELEEIVASAAVADAPIERTINGRPVPGQGERAWQIEAQPLADDAGRLGIRLAIQDVTRHVRAQERIAALNAALKRQVNEFETLLQVIPVGISIAHDPRCERITNNKYLAELVGISHRDNASIDPRAPDRSTAYRVFRDGFEIGADQLPMHQSLLHKREVHDVEFDVLVHGTRHVTLVGNAAPLFDEGGRPRGAIAAFSNITERKRAETALRESERRFRTLAEAVPQIVWTASPSGCVDYFNQRWTEYTGEASGDNQNAGWQDRLHPDDRPQCLSTWHAALSAGEVFETEARLGDRAGAYRWHLLRALPLRGADGQITRWVGTSTDIDVQKRGERRSQLLDRMSRVLTSSLDVDRTLSAIAELALPALGDLVILELRGHGTAIRRTVVSCEGESRLPLADRLRTALEAQATDVLFGASGGVPGIRDLDGDGGAAPLPPAVAQAMRDLRTSSLLAVPLSVRGRVIGALTLLHASSGRRHGDEERRLADELASRAGLAVDNARLFQEAQQASQAKDQFLAAVSHDLRTPLSTILLWAQNLQRRPLPAAVKRGLTMIEESAARQARLINDLLDLSRTTVGTFPIEPVTMDFGAVIDRAVGALLPVAAARDIRLEVERDPDLDGMEGDPERLAQVLDNLVSNALKFTPPGGTVTVSGVREDQMVRLQVADTGCGIDPEFLPRAFEPFQQGEPPAEGRRGLGIGLAIVRHIVELHDGRVSAASDGPGRGTTFTVMLPMTRHGVHT